MKLCNQIFCVINLVCDIDDRLYPMLLYDETGNKMLFTLCTMRLYYRGNIPSKRCCSGTNTVLGFT